MKDFWWIVLGVFSASLLTAVMEWLIADGVARGIKKSGILGVRDTLNSILAELEETNREGP